MFLTIFLIKITLTNCLNLTESSVNIALLLNKHRNHRIVRCPILKLDNSIQQAVFKLNRNRINGEYRKHLNSFGEDIDFGESYKKEHVLSGLLVSDNVKDCHWNDYKEIYKKNYSTKCHERAALSNWKENLQRVIKHNKLFLAGVHSYSLHLNLFGDLAVKDYFKKILKLFDTVPLFDPAEDHHKTTYRKHSRSRTPDTVDWRAKGYKPRREEQWQCGACYAFAVTHATQAQLYKRRVNWTELSPQQIVDCSFPDGNAGCDGGSLRGALRYVARVGLISEDSYPYLGKKGNCTYNRMKVRAKPRRWAMLPTGDEHAMEKALAAIGPLAVAVNAEPFTFQLYRSGIYDDPFCTPWKLNHAMLLVGYTKEYWILLNWWGRNWGEDGYMRIRRGFNRCGVANMAAYVEL